MKHLTIYKSKFFYLFCLLIIYVITVSLISSQQNGRLLLGSLFSLIILSCWFAIAIERYLLTATILAGAASLICHWIIAIISPGKELFITFYAINIIFLLVMNYSILYLIVKHEVITADILFGAVCGYFLLGFIWAFIFLAIATLTPGSFSQVQLTGSLHDNIQHFLYFSFSTLTTLGYGDILPVSNFARTCSWLEAVTGQIYLAVWISQLVGLRIATRVRLK